MKKITSILIVIVVILIGLTQKDLLIQLIKQDGANAVFISMLLAAICVFFPILPFTVLAGLVAALFGAPKGFLVSYTGAMIGTILFFFICRYGFKDWVQKTLQKHPKVQEYEEFLNRNSFVAILVARLIPVLPAPVFNSACGLSKVDWKIFLVASAIGKIPHILIVSITGANVAQNKWLSISLFGLYLLMISIITFIMVSKKITVGKNNI